MSKKFYAVKVGRIPGIYNSWDECKAQTDKFRGACFQSFRTKEEADNFLSGRGLLKVSEPFATPPQPLTTPPQPLTTPPQPLTTPQSLKFSSLSEPQTLLEIYTDGSHFKHGDGYKGFGAFTIFKGKEYRMSGHCDNDIMKLYNISPDVNFSNPTAEFIAFAETLRTMLENTKTDKKYNLTFFIDYIGVERWMKGEWQAKAPYIKSIRDKAQEYSQKLKNMGWTIEFKHVNGHSGNYGNDQTDLAAKSRSSFNEFISLAGEL